MVRENELTPQEMDVLGEIGNISMGSAATSLSQLLREEVSITTPEVDIKEFSDLFGSFTVPYISIRVNYTEGLQGFNVLIIKLDDARQMLKMLMGDRVSQGDKFNEMEMSALSEIMNQMMGSGATALNQVYKESITISTPEIELVDVEDDTSAMPHFAVNEPLVNVAFRFKIGSVVDSHALQVIPLSSAKQQVGMALKKERDRSVQKNPEQRNPEQKKPKDSAPEVTVEKAGFPPITNNPSSEEPRNIDMLMDIPLQASVVMGRATKTIQEILALAEGTVIELDKLVEDPVDLYVNGVPIARGEVVVVNGNFGLRIIEIISSSKRLESLSSLKKM